MLGAIALAMLALGFPGCDEDKQREEEEARAVVCRLWKLLGDTNCDGKVEADADRDGIVDPIDRYPYGNDFGDDDLDGYANWVDLEPFSPQSTVPAPVPSTEEQELATQRELEAEAAKLARGNEERQIVLEQMEREAERLEAEDADSDGTPDYYDPQPELHAFGDVDRDGVYNDDDLFPYSDGYR